MQEYVKRAAAVLPKQGDKSPWKVVQNYLYDKISLELSSANDKALEYS